MKKFTALTLALIVALTLAASCAESAPTTTVNVGDIIEFGGYDWRVLEVRDGRALLLSDRVLEERAYHDSYVGFTWATSDMRTYLNDTFYNSFSASDRARIVETQVTTNDNPWYGSAGGGTTTDRIFLLSIEEVVRYFGDSGELAQVPAQTHGPFTWTGEDGISYEYYVWDRHGFNDTYNESRIAYSEDGTASWWWLRSPGYHPNIAAHVDIFGLLDVLGRNVERDDGGVRPALWLELQ